jgi:hypothetical protein
MTAGNLFLEIRSPAQIRLTTGRRSLYGAESEASLHEASVDKLTEQD